MTEIEESLNGEATKFLNFMIWELAFAHPKVEHLIFNIQSSSPIRGIRIVQ